MLLSIYIVDDDNLAIDVINTLAQNGVAYNTVYSLESLQDGATQVITNIPIEVPETSRLFFLGDSTDAPSNATVLSEPAEILACLGVSPIETQTNLDVIWEMGDFDPIAAVFDVVGELNEQRNAECPPEEWDVNLDEPPAEPPEEIEPLVEVLEHMVTEVVDLAPTPIKDGDIHQPNSELAVIVTAPPSFLEPEQAVAQSVPAFQDLPPAEEVMSQPPLVQPLVPPDANVPIFGIPQAAPIPHEIMPSAHQALDTPPQSRPVSKGVRRQRGPARLRTQRDNMLTRRVYIITGATNQCGMSSFSYSLAASLAKESFQKALLIDMDVLKPDLSKKLGKVFDLEQDSDDTIDNFTQMEVDDILTNIDYLSSRISVPNSGSSFSFIRGSNLGFRSRKQLANCDFVGILDALSEVFNYIVVDIGHYNGAQTYQDILLASHFNSIMLLDCSSQESARESLALATQVTEDYMGVLSKWEQKVNVFKMQNGIQRHVLGKMPSRTSAAEVWRTGEPFGNIKDVTFKEDWEVLVEEVRRM